MKTYLFIVTIFIQLVLVGILSRQLLNRKNNVLGQKSVYPLKAQNLNFPESSLTYFYEPEANQIEKTEDWVPFQAKYSINKDSLNDRYNYSKEKQPDTYRIITMGDSFTYGVFVDTKDNWPEQLEDMLRTSDICNNAYHFEVINLGMGGYDIEYSVERYRIRGAKYDPDLIIWLLKDDDFIAWNEKTFQKVDEIRKKLEKTGKLDQMRTKDDLYPEWTLAYNKTLEEITKKNMIIHQNGIFSKFISDTDTKIIGAFIPTQQENSFELLREQTEIVDNFFIFSLPNIYLNKEFYFSDGHPTKLGHTVYAEKLLDFLESNKIIPCK